MSRCPACRHMAGCEGTKGARQNHAVGASQGVGKKVDFPASIAHFGVFEHKSCLDYFAHLPPLAVDGKFGLQPFKGKLYIHAALGDFRTLHVNGHAVALSGFQQHGKHRHQKFVVIKALVFIGKHGAGLAVQGTHHAGYILFALLPQPFVDVVRQERRASLRIRS